MKIKQHTNKTKFKSHTATIHSHAELLALTQSHTTIHRSMDLEHERERRKGEGEGGRGAWEEARAQSFARRVEGRGGREKEEKEGEPHAGGG
jgi:hypothetical protein